LAILGAQRIVIPPRGSLVRPDDDDPLDFYYRPGASIVYRTRLEHARRLLEPGRPYQALLDVGYGSGIFLPELARLARRVAGVDVHDRSDDVSRALARLDVTAELRQASVYELPYDDGEFDAAVCISVFEHLVDLDSPLRELGRVLDHDGVLVLGFPVRNPATDLFFRLVGYNPRAIHPSGHRDVLAAVDRAPHFRLERSLRLPQFLPLPLAGYLSCRLRRT
jgi:2-polyprenyl-3-methyl-5-hydroxy-6-metoxy-1,4-benzoquinol methylase